MVRHVKASIVEAIRFDCYSPGSKSAGMYLLRTFLSPMVIEKDMYQWHLWNIEWYGGCQVSRYIC